MHRKPLEEKHWKKKNPHKWSGRMWSGSLANPACDLLVCSHSVVTA